MADATSTLPSVEIPRSLLTVDLIRVCVADRKDTGAWSDLLLRLLPILRHFARTSLYRLVGSTSNSQARIHSIDLAESDLVQRIIVRLLDRDCALLKRFSGQTEHDLSIYLAVISRSTVRDALRCQNALKRGMVRETNIDWDDDERVRNACDQGYNESEAEHALLALEVKELAERMLADLPGPCSIRDKLIFQLYFYHDLSLDQIARCRGINLSKAGVNKVLNRLMKRLRMLVTVGMVCIAA